MSFSLSSGVVVEARQTIRQAQVTLAQLQKLGSLMGQFMIAEDAARGRLGNGQPPAEHEALRQSILDLLKSINLPANELAKVSSADRKWIITDYVTSILTYANLRMPSDKIAEWIKVYSKFLQTTDVNEYAGFTPDKLTELINRFGLLDNDEKAMIADYKYYLETGAPRHSIAR